MKRFAVILTTALALAVLCAFALAEETLPESIAAQLTTGNLVGSEILSAASLSGHGSDDCWFVALRTSGGANWLYCYQQQSDGAWKRQFRTNGAIPQTRNRITLAIFESGEEWPIEVIFSNPHLYIFQSDQYDEYSELTVCYALEKHSWNLWHIWGYTGGWGNILIQDGRITYYREIESSAAAGSATGEFQRNIRYVSLSAIPKTLAEARSKLTTAPYIPASDELQVYPVSFTGNQSYDVYSAPGADSVRGANGRARVSTNSWIQVFGTEGDWVLVHYSIDASHYRFGYISASSLPRNASVPALNLNRVSAWTTSAAVLTDDPLYSRSALVSLPEGTRVDLLATLGEWAYVEINENDYARGFVPLTSVTASRVLDLENQPDGSGRPLYRGQITITGEDWMEAAVSIAANGQLAGLSVASIQVMDSFSGSLLATLYLASDGCYYGNCLLGGDVTSLTLAAIGTDGTTLAAVSVEW